MDDCTEGEDSSRNKGDRSALHWHDLPTVAYQELYIIASCYFVRVCVSVLII